MNKDIFKSLKLSGRGTAVVLCFCLAVSAAAGIYSYNKTQLAAEKKQITGTSDAAEPPAAEKAAEVNAVKNDVPEENIPAHDLMPREAEEVYADNIGGDGAAVAADEKASPESGRVPAETTAAADNSGMIVRPLDGEIIVPFSNGELVKSETLNVWKTHDGIDISGEIGECVRAAAAGTVTDVYRDTMWGNCVEIEHSGGITSCYFGLGDDIAVSKGDTVNAGTVIAKVGVSAECESSEPAHLHFAMKKNGVWTDPAAAISGEGS